MLVKAQVVAIQQIKTPRGYRLYTVFRGWDHQELGLWTTLDEPGMNRLCLGDVVFLKRQASGGWSLMRYPGYGHLPHRLTQWLAKPLGWLSSNRFQDSRHRLL